MYLEKTLEVTITDIVNIVRSKQVLAIHLTCFFNGSSVYCDNYCKIKLNQGNHHFILNKQKMFVPVTVQYIHFEDIYRIINEKFKTKIWKICLCLPLRTSNYLDSNGAASRICHLSVYILTYYPLKCNFLVITIMNLCGYFSWGIFSLLDIRIY
jgi:hypothetical protein